MNKKQAPRIFLPWCFAVKAAYSVVIILPLILQTLAILFFIYCLVRGKTCPFEGVDLFLCSHKQQVVGHTQQLRFFTDIEVITEILRIVLVTHFVYSRCQQLARTIGRNLVQYIDLTVIEQLSCRIHRVKHEWKIIQSKRFFIVVPI